MRWGLRVSAEARADISSIAAYLRVEAGPRAAARYLQDINQRLVRLRDTPKAGVALPEHGPTLRFVPCRRHVIYYEFEATRIVVLRVLHAAQDRENIMSKRREKP